MVSEAARYGNSLSSDHCVRCSTAAAAWPWRTISRRNFSSSKRVARRGAQREGTVRRYACGQAHGLWSDRGSLLFRQLREQRQPAIEQAFCLALVGLRYDARDPQQRCRAYGWLRLFRLQHRREQFWRHGKL